MRTPAPGPIDITAPTTPAASHRRNGSCRVRADSAIQFAWRSTAISTRAPMVIVDSPDRIHTVSLDHDPVIGLYRLDLGLRGAVRVIDGGVVDRLPNGHGVGLVRVVDGGGAAHRSK